MLDQDYLKQVGTRVKMARVHRGLSQIRLAKIAGISADTVVCLEGGKTDAQILTYKRIAHVLEMDIKDFL